PLAAGGRATPASSPGRTSPAAMASSTAAPASTTVRSTSSATAKALASNTASVERSAWGPLRTRLTTRRTTTCLLSGGSTGAPSRQHHVGGAHEAPQIRLVAGDHPGGEATAQAAAGDLGLGDDPIERAPVDAAAQQRRDGAADLA